MHIRHCTKSSLHGSGNGLTPVRRQVIALTNMTNANLLATGSKYHKETSVKNVVCKMARIWLRL